MLSVTGDTNVLISALAYRRGKPYELLRMALDGNIDLAISPHIIEEMSDVLARKFDATPQEISEAKLLIGSAARAVTPGVSIDVVKDDPSDNRILECALAAGSQYLVTGDKHLLRLREYEGIQIVTVSDLLDIAKRQGRER